VSASKQNSQVLSGQGFFFVAEAGEISNLDSTEDITDLIKLADSIPISPNHME